MLTQARQIWVLLRRGLVRPLRLDQGLRGLRVARRAGLFPAMIAAPGRRAARAPAIVDDRGSLTFGDLESKSNALARGLAELGIGVGDAVAVVCRDHGGMVLALVATSKCGARLVFLNTGLAEPQLAEIVQREAVTAVLLDGEFVPLTGRLPATVRQVLTWVDDPTDHPGVPTVEALMAGRSAEPVALPEAPGGMVLLTSGTTGAPRGAPRTSISPLQSAQLLDRIPIPRGGTMIAAAPLFHGNGLGLFALAMALRKRVVLRRRFDAEATLADIAAHRADTAVLVPTMLQRILDLGPEVLAGYDTSSLRVVACGGSALTPDLCRRATEAFGDVLHNVYGSTEVAIISVATPAELRRAPGTAGRPPVGCRVAIVDERGDRVVEPNVTGRIFASNGLSFEGYTDGGTKDTVDGLLATGDVGHLDEAGLLAIDGRDDEMIVSGGENVFPIQVENLLADRPDVREAAVVGVDDGEFGQRLRAFVVPDPTARLGADEIKAYVRANLARYMVPRDVVFVDELPRNATGKVVRRQLHETG